MTTACLLDSKELQGCVIPEVLLSYCSELSEGWCQQGQTELALLATEAGLLVCSPAVYDSAPIALNNVRQLMLQHLSKDIEVVQASAATIRALLQEAERHSCNGRLVTRVRRQQSHTRAQQTLMDLVSEALSMQASDIHLRFTPVTAHICFRVKGQRVGHQQRSREAMVESVAASLNTCSDDFRQVFNEQSVDSASIELQMPHTMAASSALEKVRLRVQKSPLNNGFAVTLRLLPNTQDPARSFNQLGMPSDVQVAINAWLQRQHGLILFVGATGHGKTTSLAALNQSLPAHKKVISLEDPVEIVQPAVEQRWVDGGQDCFAEHIKIALREDPDVISISEIRDSATAAAAVTAALTGHLVTATLHAHDCLGALQRLANLGISINELVAPGVLQGVVAQRLIHQGDNSRLVAEYVMLDHVGRDYLRQADYRGWREHLQAHGWRSLQQRCAQLGMESPYLEEAVSVYNYRESGPYEA